MTNTIDKPLVISFEALKRLGIAFSNMALLKAEAEGKFPRRIALGGRRCAWFLAEIEAWLAERGASRDADAAVRSASAMKTVAGRQKRQQAEASAAETSPKAAVVTDGEPK